MNNDSTFSTLDRIPRGRELTQEGRSVEEGERGSDRPGRIPERAKNGRTRASLETYVRPISQTLNGLCLVFELWTGSGSKAAATTEIISYPLIGITLDIAAQLLTVLPSNMAVDVCSSV
ncbi:hypothetical protein PM082_020489 [Marasmius tenuissimus]|nr:hypothetical protein PM082_020489 [Marasmius tenuissimus]